jgi:hypothetical protein
MANFYEYEDAPDDDFDEPEVCGICVELKEALGAAVVRLREVHPFDRDEIAGAVRRRNWALDDLLKHQGTHT